MLPKGDYADRMYLLLRGQVNILLPVTQIDLIRPWKLTDEIKFELHKKYPDVETHLGGIHLDELKKPWLIFNSALDLLYKYYSTLTSGNIFGELGLLRKKPRLATILVKEDCSLAYVGKTDYVELLSRTFDYRAERKKIQFFQQYFFSGTLAENSMVKLCYLLEKGHKTSRDLVFSELQKLDNVYLIRSGDVETSKIFYISARESPNKWLSSKEYNELPLIERRFYRTQKIIIGHHSKGEMLGIEDLANTIYSCTVTCLTPTKFYYFNRTVPKLLILPNHKHFIGFVKLGS